MNEFEYAFVKYRILKLIGVDLDCYKDVQMQRRLQTFLHRSGYANWPALFRAIQDSPEDLNRLRDHLTINVSYFFRDPDKYTYLQEVIAPELMRGRPNLRVWSAGCSHGHEPYSLIVVLTELAGPYRQHQIYATDIDGAAIEWAQAGGPYTAEEVAYVPADLLARYFSLRGGRYWFNYPSLQRKIMFSQHNLTADPFVLPGTGEGEFDLIVCRNVVIYFTAESKQQLYRRFYDALRPGGVLFIGGTEIISKASEIGFDTIAMSFYRRPSQDKLQRETRPPPRRVVR